MLLLNGKLFFRPGGLLKASSLPPVDFHVRGSVHQRCCRGDNFLRSNVSVRLNFFALIFVENWLSLSSRAAGVDLTAPAAFTIFSIFAALQFTTGTLPHALKSVAEAKVAIGRLSDFLFLPEWNPPSTQGKSGDDQLPEGVAVKMSNATLNWSQHYTEGEKSDEKEESQEEQPLKATSKSNCLFDIDLEVKEGGLLGVAGAVGSGKTSLVAAIMGEVRAMTPTRYRVVAQAFPPFLTVTNNFWPRQRPRPVGFSAPTSVDFQRQSQRQHSFWQRVRAETFRTSHQRLRARSRPQSFARQ